MARQFTLGKNERLKSRKQIEQLFNQGQRFVMAPFRVFYSFHDAGELKGNLLKAGFAASSRNFKTAVARNRIKRLTREAWRLQKNQLHAALTEKALWLNVFLIYTGKELPLYSEVQETIGKVLAKLQDLCQKKN